MNPEPTDVTPARQVLIAGLGNVFAGDEGFGPVVAQRAAARILPPQIRVLDLGNRPDDLAQALQDQCDAAVLVGTMSRGGEAGTLYLIDPEQPEAPVQGSAAADATGPGHGLDPTALLQQIGDPPGRRCRRILFVGCEPETLGDPHVGVLGLSATVSAAADRAVEMVERVAAQLAGVSAIGHQHHHPPIAHPQHHEHHEQHQHQHRRRRPGPWVMVLGVVAVTALAYAARELVNQIGQQRR